MSLLRLNPDVGYVDAADLPAFGLTQVVRANGFLFMSGIAPIRGPLASLEVVAPHDMEGQLRFALDVLDRSLTACGGTRADVVNWNWFATDLDALSACGHLMTEWAGDHLPASTGVQVSKLFVAGQVLELQVTAVDAERS